MPYPTYDLLSLVDLIKRKQRYIRLLLPDAAQAPYPAYDLLSPVSLIRREQRRIRLLLPMSDAA
ncbi:hypothetical protein PFV29_003709 [Escherichia coli]|nr:hypothetical protein [Escherichia coli]EKI8157555.1 hypothetical protein [Escherichia coli]